MNRLQAELQRLYGTGRTAVLEVAGAAIAMTLMVIVMIVLILGLMQVYLLLRG